MTTTTKPSESSSEDVYGNTKSYNIPVSHLEYKYIDKCDDVKYLEKIVKVLRSGEEGRFPDLETFAEKKLETLNPKSRVLRKDKPVTRMNDLGKDEAQLILEDIDSFASTIKQQEEILGSNKGLTENLPPVRGSGFTLSASSGGEKEPKVKKSVKPRDYREWDKLDAEFEKQLNEDEKEETEKIKANQHVLRSNVSLPDTVDTSSMTEEEKNLQAEREKDKGNEAFRSGDFQEALIYYNRSLSIKESVAACNNRAQTYLKLKKWDQAIRDCENVMLKEPANLKALLRRGVGYQGKKLYVEAKNDLEKVLSQEPNNKQAKKVMGEVEKALEEQKVKGRRLVIEETDGSDTESEDESSDQPKILNGHASSETQSGGNDINNKEQVETCPNKKTESTTPGKNNVTEQKSPSVGVVSDKEPDKSNIVREEKKSEKDVEQKSSSGGNVIDKDSVKQVSAESFKQEGGEPSPPPPMPDAVLFLKNKGNDLFKSGQYGDAIEVYNKAIAKLEKDQLQYQNTAVLYNNRAACKTKVGDCKGCIDDCSKSLNLVPGNGKAILRRAVAYENKESYGLAYDDYRQVLRLDHTAVVAQQGSTRCSQALQQLHGTSWREHLPSSKVTSGTKAPQSPLPTSQTSSTQQSKKVQDQIPSHKSKPTHAGSGDSPRKSSFDGKRGDKEKLFEEYKTQGNTFVQKAKFKDAIAMYNRCIELFPDRVAPLTNKALCHLRSLKPEKALEDCDAALALEPNNVKALYRKGQALKMLGKYDEAASAYVKVLQEDRENTAASKELGDIIKFKKQMETNKKNKEDSQQRRKVQIEEVDTSSSSESSDEDECHNSQNASSKTAQPSEQPPTPRTTGTKIEEVKSSTKNSSNEVNKEQVKRKATTTPMKAKSTLKATAGDITPKIDLKKATPFEFMSAWTSLKGTNELDPYAKLLAQVPPCNLAKVVSNKLEGDMLKLIVKCVGRFISQKTCEPKDCFLYLKNLATVPRFEMNTMFMSTAEKNDIMDVFNQLHEVIGSNVSDTEFAKVKKSYGL